MVCDEAYMRLKTGHGFLEVLHAKATELYTKLNESPDAFLTIAGLYQELRVLVELGEKKFLMPLDDYWNFLRCVAKHI